MAASKKAQVNPRAQRKANKAAVSNAHGVKCSFQEFFLVWASLQGWEVPKVHFDIMDFLVNHKKWQNNIGVLQVFRGVGKSTITGLFIVWMLTQDPTLRFLVLSADKKTATKITLDVANIMRVHPLAKHLHGEENINRADALYVRGFKDARTPSVTSWGVLSNIVGSRADWIIYDDTEVEKNTRTETERENLRTKLLQPTHILVPGGFELFIGTPHAYESIYPEILGEVETDFRIRDGASSLKIPVIENLSGEFPNFDGDPIWPERFPIEEIRKRASGSGTKGHFMSQYLLLPYNPDDTVLDPTLISTYSHELSTYQANGGVVARIGDTRVVSATCFWDPALSTVTTDDSVLAVVFTTEDGHYYIHRTVQLTGDPDEQCRQIVRVMKELDLPHVVIETNGIGNFLPAILRKHMAGTGLTCEGKATTQSKLQKIMEAYDVRLSGGFLHAHKSVMDSRFRTQLRDFSAKTVNRSKDDYIDAVAMCILSQPIRLRAGHYGSRGQSWAVGASTVEVEMDSVAF